MATTSLQRILWLGAFLCASAGALLAADPPRGRPIEFSEPRNERDATNAPSLMPGRTTMFDLLEADINRPFKEMIPGNSLNGMIITDPRPLPPPPAPSSRTRDAANRKRDQMYLTPEEMFAVKPLEDSYKAPELTPDGRNVNSLSGLERQIYRTFNSGSSSATNRANALTGSGSIIGPGYGRNDGSLPTSPGGRSSFGIMNPLENNLRRALGIDGEGAATARARDMRDSRDLFGLGETPGTANKLTPAEARHRDAFMQLYNPGFTPSAGGAVPGGGLYAPDSSFYDPPKPMVAAPPTILPGTYGNAAGASTPYTPSYVPPVAPPVQVNPVLAPVSPFMNVPRRNF